MAGVKITDLTPLATAASDDLLYIVDVSDTTESPEGTSKSIEVGNIARPYKVYTALLTQSGFDAPTAIVLENTLDGTISFSYSAVGIYEIQNTTAWDISKTWYCITDIGNTSEISVATPGLRYMTFEGPFYIYTFDNSSISSNGVLGSTPIEIRVYN